MSSIEPVFLVNSKSTVNRSGFTVWEALEKQSRIRSCTFLATALYYTATLPPFLPFININKYNVQVLYRRDENLALFIIIITQGQKER